jgi:hypothetical protein
MRKRLSSLIAFLCLIVGTATAEDLLRICSAYYPGGCSLHIYDYSGSINDFHSLWCGGDLIYESGGLGGRIGSHGNCTYFL